MMESRINVLLVVNSLGVGGAEKHAIALLNTLDTRRFRLSFSWLKDETLLLPQLQTERAEGGVFCAQVTRKVDLQAVRRLAAHIAREQIDVVLCTNTYSLLYAWLARMQGPACPRIVEVFHTTEIGTLEDRLQMLFYRPWILAVDRLVYVCESQRRYWRARLLRARADLVIHNGIDTQHFSDRYSAAEKARLRAHYGFAPSDYVIGLCAALRPEKAHEDLVAAIACLRAQGLPARALLIGDGPQRGAIEAAIAEHELQDAVRITGFCADVRPLIAACDVMTITSHSVETFSIAALEAMALGKPMVMTDIGGAAEQITPGVNGFLYPRGNIDALCDALRILQARGMRTTMGGQARESVVQRFSLERMVDAYARLFEDMVSKDGLAREAQRVA